MYEYIHNGHRVPTLDKRNVEGYEHSFCPMCGDDLGMQPGRDNGLVLVPSEGEVFIIFQDENPRLGETVRYATDSEVASLAEALISPARLADGWAYFVQAPHHPQLA